MELGTLLKEARMEKGLTLDDIQEQTKIRKKYLKAIENNEFDIIPGNVYVKVFIKGYARQVGIDYIDLVEEYEILSKDNESEKDINKNILPGGEFKYQPIHNKKKFSFLKIILIILFSLFVFASGFFVYQYFFLSDITNNTISNITEDENQQIIVEENIDNQETLKENDNSQVNTENNENNISDLNMMKPVEKSEENNPISEDENTINDENGENNTSLSDNNMNSDGSNEEKRDNLVENQVNQDDNINSSAVNNDGLSSTEVTMESNATLNDNEESVENDSVLEENGEDKSSENISLNDLNILIKSADLAWIRIDVDGEDAYRGLLDEGEEMEFDAEKNLYIKIGNGAAITAVVDGKEYGPWGESGEIAEAEIKIEDGEIVVNNLRD